MKLKQAYRAAYSIRRCKTKQGKRRAILRWCRYEGGFEMSGYPTLPCRMCGDEKTACLEYSTIHEEAQVCYRCADIVANVFSMKHSGQYLTWPNEILLSRYRERKNISAKTRKAVMERDGYRCVKCESFIDLQIDHIYPHSKGGSDEPENLQTLCAVCNRIKKDKVEAEV